MRWLIFIIIFTASCSSNNPKYTEQRLFDKVLAASDTHDATALTETDYDNVSGYISQGESRWIALYPRLSQAPFPGVTAFQEGLPVSMAYALSANPAAVIKFLNNTNITLICGMPFIEPTPDEIADYFIKTRRALEKLASGGDEQQRCLTRLNAAKAEKADTITGSKKATLGSPF